MNGLTRVRFILVIAAIVAIGAEPARAEPPKRVLLVGQGPDGHPFTTHEYMAGVTLLAKLLGRVPGIEATVVRADEPWKEGPELLARPDGVVLFVSEGARFMQADPRRLEALQQLAARRGGIAALHWGVGAKDPRYIDGCLKLLGGCHGGPDRMYQYLETDVRPAEHPVAAGIDYFRVHDEFYYRLKFVAPPGSARPVLKATIDGRPETVAWAWERPDGGRSFGYSGLHYHENWKRPEYRRLTVQGVLWTLRIEPPPEGLNLAVTPEDLVLEVRKK